LHRPALEVAKLLLALDPRDPMGAFDNRDSHAFLLASNAWQIS